MKDAKEYQDRIFGLSVRDAIGIIPEIIKDYGYQGKILFDRNEYDNFVWNHEIRGFVLGEDNIVYAIVYWQGDLTDGDMWVPVRELVYGKVIPAEWSDGHYCVHSSLRIEREEFERAVKAISDYLEPQRIAERDRSHRIYALECRAMEIFVKPLWKRGWSVFSQSYHNAQNAVWELIANEFKKFEKMSDEELIPIFDTVWHNNAKNYKIENFDLTY